ncbi:phospholipid/cholesterol/gamma-HCH transport system ATP-binding protein [Desulfocicer vacuolatum DSM 3385]|uniref:Phospholipid/cholesterol/gamma-HCH transport system ATP-binding protein n=1 Tax=Desulfocicer vacuolatum DSM 3385 TaxID=1121400 RepID=A0A1W1ZMY9_9BACT|nr:ATP-binding cassette domain-containing protein [Desulfocicer vacuolatum]SMC49776.1 phospholipid/cholesterol/gamma-HCH transport system ATP-binding protein [Desulfocicer vacuolatum DSM 3385]
MTTPLIEFVNVKKRFGNIRVMDGLNLSIHRGQITAVIGKSGSGKSVLLKHIIGLEEQDSGSIFYDGRDMAQMDRTARRKFKKRVSYMFQDNALFDAMTVFENIALPIVEKSTLSREEIKERVLTRVNQLDITGTEEKYPAQLSGGMRKRVALARALITDPEVVLFDEPTTGLDPVRKQGVHGMIKEYQAQFGFTALVVSHEIPEIFDIAQQVAMLDQGKIILQDNTEQFLRTNLDVVRCFIHGKEKTGEKI